MTLVDLLILLFVAGVCGSLAQALVGYSRGGCLVSIVLGFIGAFLGTWFARAAGIADFYTLQIGDRSYPIIWSIIGATLFVAVLSLFTRRGRLPE